MGPWVLAAMFLLGGAVFAAAGYASLKSTRRKLATWIQATAEVVSLAEELSDGKARTLYAPVYRYYADGAERTAKSKIASSPARYRVGDTFLVLVDPMNPSDAEIIERTPLAFSYGIMILGLIVFAIGLLLAWLVSTGRMTFG